MKSCLIITGGSLDISFASFYLKDRRFNHIIAVDGGLEAADQLNILPDIVVGDFDTLSKDIFEKYKKFDSIIWEKHIPEKDETDTELALRIAVNRDCHQITILGAMGGRADHMFANVHALKYCADYDIDAAIVDEQNKIYLIRDKKVFKKSSLYGKYVSFLPFTDRVSEMQLTGFRYKLNHKTLIKGQDSGLCISNELQEETGCVELKDGILLCIESHD